MSAPSPHFRRGYHAGMQRARQIIETDLQEIRARLYLLMKQEGELSRQLSETK